ncbi:MAG: hypothetical protein JWL84_1974 [Rhodospirillales bacterium]|jgi:hypothetical protein|nr:hypothetical protein [Rhodospirillales bacterium]
MIETVSVTATWKDLGLELDAWQASDRRAALWWRDDDAVAATPALDVLIDLARAVPLALAVIPGRALDELARRVDRCANISILQHGWRHENHAAEGEKKSELGAQRPLATILGELASGWRKLVALFGPRAAPVLTPPWNRVAEALLPLLPDAGYIGVSTFGPRRTALPHPALVQANTHVDLVDWPHRSFVGAPRALGLLVGHLAARRSGRVDASEPTGILTHHLLLDRDGAGFLGRLVAVTCRHPATRWLTAAEVFAAP